MSLALCEKNKHIYNNSAHKACPYCGILDMFDLYGADEGMSVMDSEMRLENFPLERSKRTVGWLVCVVGNQKGKDYRIAPEKNFVGRAEDMDIQIVGDDDINDRNHAVITYDPEKNETYVFAGFSNGIVHRLGVTADYNAGWEMVDSFQKLDAGDRLKMGKSEFLFVPFCSNDANGFIFDWKQEKDE